MSKLPTFPILFEDVLQLSISDLSKRGYFKESVSGTISWSLDSKVIAKITVSSLINGNPCIVLSYNYNNEAKEYRVQLEAKNSNLGTGMHWYFICPVTKGRCRKLYLVNDLFLHRDAFKNIACYKSQTESKPWRELRTKMERHYSRDEVLRELNRKYIKKFYNGEPTRTYLSLMRKIHG